MQLAALIGALTLFSTSTALADPPQQWQGPYGGYSYNNSQDNDDQGDRDGDDRKQSCTNPAGNQRGWCKKHNRRGNGNGNCNYNYNGYPNNGQNPYPNNGQYPYPNNGQYSNNGCNNSGYNNNGYSNATLRGVVTGVNGSTVSIVQGLGTITFDASQAFQTGRVNGQLYPTRSITAQGYYDNNRYFHATVIN